VLVIAFFISIPLDHSRETWPKSKGGETGKRNRQVKLVAFQSS
jgi:hypothetical protein